MNIEIKRIYVLCVSVCFIVFSVGLFYCSLIDVKSVVGQTKITDNQISAIELIEKVRQTYSAFNFYRSKGMNVYYRKGFGDLESKFRKIEIEYISPSELKAKVISDDKTTLLTSNKNITKLFVDDIKKVEYDDLLWGLGSSKLGDGRYFEVGKILVLGNRGKGRFSGFEDFTSWQILSGEDIEGYSCYKIEGTANFDALIKKTFWVDKASFIIRQVEHFSPMRKIPDGYFKTVETYTDIEKK
jgi:hypothetical protein